MVILLASNTIIILLFLAISTKTFIILDLIMFLRKSFKLARFFFFFFFLQGTLSGARKIAGKGLENECGCGELFKDRGPSEELRGSRNLNQSAIQNWKCKLHLCLEGECSTQKAKVKVPLVHLTKKQI